MPRKRKDAVYRPQGTKNYAYTWTIDGHRSRGTTGTDDYAQACQIAFAERDKLIARIKLGHVEDVHLTLETAFEEYWEGYASRLGSAATVEGRIDNLKRIIGPTVLLAELDNRRIGDYVTARLKEGRAVVKNRGKDGYTVERTGPPIEPATVNREMDTLFGMRRWIRARYKGQPLAIADADRGEHRLEEPDPVAVYLSYQQAEELIAATVRHAHEPQQIALLTGLRRENVMTLDWQKNVFLDRRRIGVRMKSRRQGGRVHEVDLIPEAIEILIRLQPDPAKRRGPVFVYGNPAVGCPCWHCTSDKSPLHGERIQSIKKTFDTARKAIGMPDVRFHDLRHTVASWLLQQGYTLKFVQELLGHATIKTTTRYAHLEKGQLGEAMTSALSVRGRAPASKGTAVVKEVS